MMHYYAINNWGQRSVLSNQILKAINGEYAAIHCYGEIIQMAPSQKVREVVTEIRQDEIRHFETFSQMYQQLTGTQPQIQKQPSCPNSYVDAIKAAFIDEQETVDFYYGIASGTSDSTIQSAFKRAAADEQNHAVWFLYFLMGHQ